MTKSWSATIRILPAVALLGAAVAFAETPPERKTAAVPEGAAKTAVATAPATTMGKPENAKWTATTYEAATADVNKKVLEGGKPATITGEVVDVSCYLQLGKKGEAHVACGTKCIEHGQPMGLLESDGDLYILFAEEHHPRRDGGVDLKMAFLPQLAKQVTVSGMMTDTKGYKSLFVSATELGAVVKRAEPAAADEK